MKNLQGFSLFEVLVALLISSVMVMLLVDQAEKAILSTARAGTVFDKAIELKNEN